MTYQEQPDDWRMTLTMSEKETRHDLESEIARLQKSIVLSDDDAEKRMLAERLAQLEARVEEWR